MHQLDEGVPKELLSDRIDVSVPGLDKHYDQRSEPLEANLNQYAIRDGGQPIEDTEDQ